MNNAYWLIKIRGGVPTLLGPFATDAARENEYDVCLIDGNNEYLIFIDPGSVPHPNQPYLWIPSKEYERERLDYIDSLPDEDYT